MFTARWRFMRLFGVPIYVDASWLVILGLLSWTLAGHLFAQEMPEAQPWLLWAMGLLTALAFFACILLHEMGHALVGRAFGMPIRGITLFLFGGVAELGAEPAFAGSEFLMAVAGPVVSALLAVLCWALATAGTPGEPMVLMFRYLALINAAVLVFNLLPAFPLDGGRVFRSVLWGLTGNVRRATFAASLAGQGFAWILMLWGVGDMLRGAIVPGMWKCLVGMFLNNAARGSYRQVLIRQALHGEPVRHFMDREPVAVPPGLDLRRWVQEYVYRFHRRAFPVASDGRLEGYITTQALTRYPRQEWERHTVGEVMRQQLDAVTVSPDTDALEALRRMERVGANRLLVTDGERLVGVVTMRDLLRFLNLKLELDAER
jgi:Zn-dependent protease/CBS domain-containing protein